MLNENIFPSRGNSKSDFEFTQVLSDAIEKALKVEVVGIPRYDSALTCILQSDGYEVNFNYDSWPLLLNEIANNCNILLDKYQWKLARTNAIRAIASLLEMDLYRYKDSDIAPVLENKIAFLNNELI